ncbi:MAG: helix-turn-helix domain-containing protein [Sutterellaceae bacterium]|nr:helix-turn-helix domain-containing protein [Sutterellaceae bacterium]MDD7441750.1 S24 family peptidase [Sutterellaceae bacterium]MDY2868683.1 S24 family peptidase [Mesosutterella sp.]
MAQWHERLRFAMEANGVTSADLVRATGLSAPAIKKWVDGLVSAPKYDDVIRASTALKVSPEWLMSGKGEIDIAGNIPAMVRIQPVRPAAGNAPVVHQVTVTPEWFAKRFPGLRPGEVRLLTMEGDSMAPVIADGDPVFLDVRKGEGMEDAVYAFEFGSETYVRAVTRAPGKFIFTCANPAFGSFELTRAEAEGVQVLGRVLGLRWGGR